MNSPPTISVQHGYRIIGHILKYHFLRQSETFSDPEIVDLMRGKILQDLQTWFDSLQELVPSDFCKMTTTSSEAPIVAYYALHLYHCLHVLVYGKMDLINMYHDTEWQASADFVKAGENAMTCAIVMIFPPIVRRS